MKIAALVLAAATLLSVAPAIASPPPTRPVIRYYVIDGGRAKLAGPFSSYYACNARLAKLEKSHGAAIFCASDWIGR